MAILNYTTKVPPEKTVLEIQRILSRHAEAVMVEYASGKPRAVSFALTVSGRRVSFSIPSNAEGVLKALYRDRVAIGYRNIEHASRVAWRVVKDWVEAQIAIVDANQASMAEVFLPYAVVSEGRTMYQQFEAHVARGLLTAGDKEEASHG